MENERGGETERDLSLSSQMNFLRGPITLFPGFSSSSSSDPFFSPSSDCCLSSCDHNSVPVLQSDILQCEYFRVRGSYVANMAIQSRLCLTE